MSKNSHRVFNNHNKTLLELFNKGISSVKPDNFLKKFLNIYKDKIIVRDGKSCKEYSNFKNVIPICVGKASVDMGKTSLSLLKKLKKNILEGIIIVNNENFQEVQGFKCFRSGHPIPNKDGLLAARFLEKKLEVLDNDCLVLFFLSGGGSALLPYPSSNISLNDKIKINELLLSCGANIKEINTVRKHLSKIKGGNFLKMSHPAKVHTFILSDVIGDDLSSIASGPTVPDSTSFNDVKKILQNYNLWNKLSFSIKDHVNTGISDKEFETPKKNSLLFKNVKNTIVGSNFQCLQTIHNLCKSKKINSNIWKRDVEGDVEDLAKRFVTDIKKKKFNKPIILISGGESTVKLRGNGKGGRNQEFALQFIKYADKVIPNYKFTLLSIGTDGRDGPTDAAGAIVDQDSLTKINDITNFELEKELNNNNSYEVLKKINSLVIINGTNTNVADLQIIMLE